MIKCPKPLFTSSFAKEYLALHVCKFHRTNNLWWCADKDWVVTAAHQLWQYHCCSLNIVTKLIAAPPHEWSLAGDTGTMCLCSIILGWAGTLYLIVCNGVLIIRSNAPCPVPRIIAWNVGRAKNGFPLIISTQSIVLMGNLSHSNLLATLTHTHCDICKQSTIISVHLCKQVCFNYNIVQHWIQTEHE